MNLQFKSVRITPSLRLIFVFLFVGLQALIPLSGQLGNAQAAPVFSVGHPAPQAGTNDPKLILTKTIDGNPTSANVGDELHYRIRFECSSLTTSCGEMQITDVLPVGLTYNSTVSSVPGGFTMAYNAGSRTVTITKDDNNLLDGSQFDAVIAVTVDYTLRPLPQTLTNTIDGQIKPPGATAWIPATSDSIPITINGVSPAWTLTKSLLRPQINPTLDTDVTYQLQLCPDAVSGNVALSNISMTDTLPAGVTFVSASNGGIESLGVVTWSIAGPILPPSCATRTVTVRYRSTTVGGPFSIGDSVTNGVAIIADYIQSDGSTCPGCMGKTNSITHLLDPISAVPSYSKTDAGDPVGISGTARFNLNLNTNGTNYPSNALVMTDNLPAELAVMQVATGTWDASFDYVRAYVEYSTDMGATFIAFPGQPVSYNTNATYNAPVTNITNVRWRFEYDEDGDGIYTPGLPYTWSFSSSPQIRVTPRATATNATDGSSTVLPKAVVNTTYTNCVWLSRVDNTGPVTDSCQNENMTVRGDYASLSVSKSETPGGSWDQWDDPNISTFTADTSILPGDTLKYSIKVDLTERSSIALDGLTIQDTLPADLVFVRFGNAQLDGVALPTAGVDAPTTSQAGQVLTWHWNKSGSGTPELNITPLTYGSHTIKVEFYARIPRGQAPGVRTNNLDVVTDSADMRCETGPAGQTDTSDIDGDSNTAEAACKPTDTYTVERSAALRGEKWIRSTDALNAVIINKDTFLPDAACPNGGTTGLTGSNPFTRYPCISQAFPQGAFVPGSHVPPSSSTTIDDFEYSLRIFNEGNVDMINYVLYDILPYYGDKGSGGTLQYSDRLSEFRPMMRGPVQVITPNPAGLTASDVTIEYNLTTNPCRPEVFNQASGAVPAACDNNWKTEADILALPGQWDNVRSYRVKLNAGKAIPPASPSGAARELILGVPMYIPADAPALGAFNNDDPQSHEIAWNSFAHVGSYYDASGFTRDLLASEPRKVGITIPEVMSVGNRVWRDSDNSGTINAPDNTNPGIANVTVNLYRDADNNGVPDGAAIATTTTDTNGYYLFSNIPYDTVTAANNRYIIGIPASNFGAGQPLENLRSSTGAPASALYTNPPTNTADSADDGIDPASSGQEVLSATFTLQPSAEPTSETDLSSNARDGIVGASRGVNGERDNNSDLTIDFGFFGGSDIPFSIGNHVWYDNGAGGGTINDGIRQAGEPPVVGVTVRLYRDGNANGIPEAAEMIRTDITDANGFYLFDNLDPGPYFVEIPASEFADGKPLAGWYSSQSTGTENTGVAGNTNTPNTDSDDNGIDTDFPQNDGVFSGVIVLTRGVNETTGETYVSGDTSAASGFNPTAGDGPNSRGRFGETDATSNLTVDFGFIPPMSLGNRVWIDEGAGEATFRSGYNNGLMDGAEQGVSGVRVELWRDTNGIAGLQTGSDTRIERLNTDSNGYYLFDRLQPGDYYIYISQWNFNNSSRPLYGYLSSFDSNQTTTPADDAEDTDDDGIDNSNPSSGGVKSPKITMAYHTEPVTPGNETDLSANTTAYGANNVGLYGQQDDNSNLTMDFGFVRPPRSLGNRLWFDTNNDGQMNGSEQPLPAGVRVSLYLDANGDGVPDDLGTPGDRTDDWLLYDLTDSNGYYLFDNLPPRKYIVGVDSSNFQSGGVLQGYYSSTNNVDNASNNNDNRDNGVDRANPENPTISPHGIISTSIDLGAVSGYPTGETGSGDIGTTAGFNPTAGDGPQSRGRFGETDANSDLTIDFGFYKTEIGNLVYFDSNANGTYDTGDTLLDNVLVQLFNGSGAEIITGADGIPNTPDDGWGPDGVSGNADDGAGGILTGSGSLGNGEYLFSGLPDGTYIIKAATPNNMISTRDEFDSTDNTTPDTNTDNNDNGIGRGNGTVSSGTVTMSAGSAGAKNNNIVDDGTGTTVDLGATRNPTLDFGFVYPYALGNRVWFDTDNNAQINGSEVGVDGVLVQLYDADASGKATGAVLASDTTTNGGYYLFDNLVAGDYVVVIPEDNFRNMGAGDLVAGDPLKGYWSSLTSMQANSALTETTAPDPDNAGADSTPNTADDDVDSDDNGTRETSGTLSGAVISQAVTLGLNGLTEPTNESDLETGVNQGAQPDGRANMKVDFGFYKTEIGNLVFGDANKNGIYDTGDSLLNGVTLRLYSSNGTEITVGPDGIYGTSDDATGNILTDVQTDASGNYLFSGLPAGDYIVKATAPNGTVSTIDTNPSNTPADVSNPDTNTDNNDNGVGTTDGGATRLITSSTSNPLTMTPGSAGANNNNTITDSTGTTRNLTLDFGFTTVFALGNRVWYDTNNNAAWDTGEVGVDGVIVKLYAADASGNPTGSVLATDTTANGGYYLFDYLDAGDYVVVVPAADNFAAGKALEGYYSSQTNRTSSGSLSETIAPDPDLGPDGSVGGGDDDKDLDDNGTRQTTGSFTGDVISKAVTLGPTAVEPTAETQTESGVGQGSQPDNQANMTVDFGFYTITLGDLVWDDANTKNNGLFESATENGIDGVDIQLWSGDGTTQLGTTTTAGGGLYSFTGLAAGDYILRIPAAEFEGTGTLRDYVSSTGAANAYEPAPDADTNTTDSDDNGTETGGMTGLGGYVQTAVVTLTPAGEASVNNSTGATAEPRVDFGLFNSPEVDLAITKDDGQTFYIQNGTLTYTIVVTNNGPADVTGAVVSDTLPTQIASWSWVCTSATGGASGCNAVTNSTANFGDTINLPKDATMTYTVTATISGTASGDLTNTVTVAPPSGTTETNSTNNSASDTDKPAILTITKDDGLSIVAPDKTLTYTIKITNNGEVPLTDLTLVDTLPGDVTYQSATLTPSTVTSATITWNHAALGLPGSLDVGSSVSVDVTVQVKSAPVGSSITNSVTVNDSVTNSTATNTDKDTLAKTSSKTLVSTTEADSTDPKVFIGETLNYRISITVPPGTMTNLKATDVLEAGLAFDECATGVTVTGGASMTTTKTGGFAAACPAASGDPNVTGNGHNVVFDFGTITNSSASDQTITVDYTAVVLNIASNVNGVTGLNNAVTWNWDGGSLTKSATPVEIIEPQMTIDKQVSPEQALLHSTLTYTIDVAHDLISAADAYDVVLTDVVPSGVIYDVGSLTSTGLAPTTTNYDAGTNTLTITWDHFPLLATSSISFTATFIGPSPVINSANIAWTSLPIDPQPSGQPVVQSNYNSDSTERWYDPADLAGVNGYNVTSSTIVRVPRLPETGFAPDRVTVVPSQPAAKTYTELDSYIVDIPRLGVSIPIVGVPMSDQGWDLTWLSGQAGWLEGTAYPTWAGNTALAGHVYLADGTPGPFVNLHQLRWGDKIIIRANGKVYTYQVRETRQVWPYDLSVLKHEQYDWVTLITCKDFNEKADRYQKRVVVRAVLINVQK